MSHNTTGPHTPVECFDPRGIANADQSATRQGHQWRYQGSDVPPEDARPRSVTVGLFIGETEVARTAVNVPSDEAVPVQFTHTLLDDADILPATVALLAPSDDPLPSDDRRHLWLAAEDGPPLPEPYREFQGFNAAGRPNGYKLSNVEMIAPLDPEDGGPGGSGQRLKIT